MSHRMPNPYNAKLVYSPNVEGAVLRTLAALNVVSSAENQQKEKEIKLVATTDKKTTARKTADRLLQERALDIVCAYCSCGRSASDVQLWDLIKTLPECKGAVLVGRIFEIATRHGYNTAARELVTASIDANSYASFCKKCGCRWSDHAADGSCSNAEPCLISANEIL